MKFFNWFSKTPESAPVANSSNGLVNPQNGIGSGRDVTQFNSYIPPNNSVGWQELDNLYRTSIFARRIIDIPATDMTRKWREFIDDDAKLVRERAKAERKYQVATKFQQLIKWADLYGTAALMIVTQPGNDLSTPLQDSELINGGFIKFAPIFMGQFNPTSVLSLSPFSEHQGRPEFYTVNSVQPFTIHQSRLIILDGIELPLYAQLNRAGFGDSRLTAVMNHINSLELLLKNLTNLAAKAVVDRIALKDFSDMAVKLCNNGGTELNNVLAVVKNVLSNQNIMVSDVEDKFSRNELEALSGWPDMLRFLIQVAGSGGDLPITKFIGEGVEGFNSGETGMLEYYDGINARQWGLTSQLVQADKVLELAYFGSEKNLQYDFVKLIPESATQVANRHLVEAQTDISYYEAGVLNRETVLRSMQDRSDYDLPDAYIEKEAQHEDEVEDLEDDNEIKALEEALKMGGILPDGTSPVTKDTTSAMPQRKTPRDPATVEAMKSDKPNMKTSVTAKS